MTSASIIHFIGFVTRLDSEKFIPAWEQYAKKEMFRKKAPLLLHQENGSRNKFSFISQHSWPESETHFSFTKSDKAGYFHDMPVQVVHIGGYQSIGQINTHLHKDVDCRLLVMAGHHENDPAFFQSIPGSFRLNSYQAYYESCTHGYLFEYFADEQGMEEIINTLKQRTGTEHIIYKDCLAPHI
ncbi:MAG: hypothetical protein HYZ15_15655 [Sphingobacteriales bacterium]|nr:hypothetical protein [Sphingobacteriales bacterium]